MEILIVVFVILSLIGSISFLKPSKKMKGLGAIRHIASKEGFKNKYNELFPDKPKENIENQPAFFDPKTNIRYINEVAALEQGMTATATHLFYCKETYITVAVGVFHNVPCCLYNEARMSF